MSYENLLTEIGDDFVAEITLNRPDQLNTFNTPLAGGLVQALEELDADTKVRVIIVKGAGKAFCAGIDVNELEGKTAMEYKAWIEHMEKPLVTISRMSKPVIAQVHGVAAANGAGLVAAADLAIAAENTRFGLTAINVGLNCIGPVVPVTRSVGRKRALELLLYGDLIKAPIALEMGLINRVVPNGEARRAAEALAHDLAKFPQMCMNLDRTSVYRQWDLPFEHAMKAEFAHGVAAVDAEGQSGAARFADGAGRSGSFSD